MSKSTTPSRDENMNEAIDEEDEDDDDDEEDEDDFLARELGEDWG